MNSAQHGRKLLFGTLIGLLLILLLVLLLPALIDTSRMKTVLEGKLQEQTHRGVRIRNVRLSLWSGFCLLAEGIIVDEDTAFGSRPFMEADSMRIRLSLASLLYGRQDPAAIEIRGAKIQLLQKPQGWNFETLTQAAALPTASGDKASTARSNELPDLSIQDSQIRIYPQLGTDPLILEEFGFSITRGLLSSGYRFNSGSTIKLGRGNANLKAGGSFQSALSAREAIDSLQADFSLTGLPMDAIGSLLQSHRNEMRIPPVSGVLGWTGKLVPEGRDLRVLSGRLVLDELKRADAGNDPTAITLRVDYLTKLRCDLLSLLQHSPGATLPSSCDLDIEKMEFAAGETAIQIFGKIQDFLGSPKLAVRASSKAAAPMDLLRLAALLRGGATPSATEGKLSFDLQVAGPLEGPRWVGTFDSQKLAYHYPDLKVPITISSIHADLDGERLRTNRFSAGVGGETLLTVIAEAADLSRDPSLNLQIQTTRPVPLQELLRIGASFGVRLPAQMQVESGSATLDFNAEDVRLKSRHFKMRGQAVLSQAVFRMASLKEAIRIPSIQLDMKDGQIRSNRFDVDMGEDGGLSAEFQIADSAAGPDIRAAVRSSRPLNAERWLEASQAWGLQVPNGLRLKGGKLLCDLDLRSYANQEPILQGSLQFLEGEIGANLATEPLLIRRASLEMRSQQLNLRELDAQFLETSIRGTAAIALQKPPRISLTLQADRINVNRLKAALTISLMQVTKGQPLRIVTPERSQAFSQIGIMDGHFNIQRLTYDNLELSNVDTSFSFGQNILNLSNLNFDVSSGKHQGSLRLDLGRDVPQFQYQGKLQSVNVHELLSRNTRMVNILYGRFDSTSTLSGQGDSPETIAATLRGNGVYRLSSGRITTFNLGRQIALLTRLTGWNLEGRTTELEEVDGNFRLEGGRIHLEKSRVRTPEAFVLCDGSIGMDHSLDLLGTAELSDQWKEPGNLLGQVVAGAAAVFFRSETGKIMVPFHLQGTVEDPAFVLDPETTQKALSRILRPENIQSGVKAIEDLIRKTGKSITTTTLAPIGVPPPGPGSVTTTTIAPPTADLIGGIGALVGGILGAVQPTPAGSKVAGEASGAVITPNVTDLTQELSLLAAMPSTVLNATEKKARIDRLLRLLFAASPP